MIECLTFPTTRNFICLTIFSYHPRPTTAIHWQGSNRRFGISFRQVGHVARCFGSYLPVQFWYFRAQLAHMFWEPGMGQLYLAVEQPCTDQGRGRGGLCQDSWQEREEETLANYSVVGGESGTRWYRCVDLLETHQCAIGVVCVSLRSAWYGIQQQNVA